jgi:hypothetical protein
MLMHEFTKLPQSKYPLTKSSSARLLRWYETACLIRFISEAEGLQVPLHSPMWEAYDKLFVDAVELAGDIADILQQRGYSIGFLNAKYWEIWEDVSA